jgi:hypothetical protein
LNACGYSLGAVFMLIRMDTLMLHNANPILATPEETVLVTEAGNQRFFTVSLDIGAA